MTGGLPMMLGFTVNQRVAMLDRHDASGLHHLTNAGMAYGLEFAAGESVHFAFRKKRQPLLHWPAVFYGALGLTIGDKHFTALRRSATNVLVGDHKHASSMIALHYLTDRVQDPLLYIVTDMLTTLRRLFVYYPEIAHKILNAIRAFESKAKSGVLQVP